MLRAIVLALIIKLTVPTLFLWLLREALALK